MMRKNWKLDKLPNEASRPQLYDLVILGGLEIKAGVVYPTPKSPEPYSIHCFYIINLALNVKTAFPNDVFVTTNIGLA